MCEGSVRELEVGLQCVGVGEMVLQGKEMTELGQ